VIEDDEARGPSQEAASRPKAAVSQIHERTTRPNFLWLVAAGVLLAVIAHWPLALHLDRDIVDVEFGDPFLQAWQVAWGGFGLLHQPLSYFDANAFWPLDNSLAFSDALIGYAPMGLIGSGARAALIRYNLLFLFAYTLSFTGAALLARELGARGAAAAVAGAAFAYAPWRIAQNTHLHVISSGGIPLSLFLLLRGYRKNKPLSVAAGWAVAGWQLSLGFTLGLQLAYLLAALAALFILAWLRGGRPTFDRRLLLVTVAGIIGFMGWAAIQAGPYLEVVGEHPEARRTEEEVTFFSPPPDGLLAAPEENSVWGEATASIRDRLPWPTEQALFPGVFILGLAVVGLTSSTYARWTRGGLAAAVVVITVMSLGLRGPGNGFAYRLLYELGPGWEGIRTPGRLTTLSSLALALLVGAGAHALLRREAGATEDRWRIVAPYALGALLVMAIVMEGSGKAPLSAAPLPPAGIEAAPSPQFHLPSDAFKDPLYMFWSTDGFPPLVNGHSGFIPTSLSRVRSETAGFPDTESVELLRRIGVRSVIVHHGFIPGTPWENALSRSIENLAVSREDRPGFTIYTLE
jgi:hypothetical protein